MTSDLSFLDGGGEAAARIRERDWSDHPLGDPERWPAEMRAALSLVLNSPESMILAWGRDLHFFFNDSYAPLLGPRAAWATGERFDRVWADAWAQAKPIIDEAMAGRPRRFVNLPWKLDTDRGARDTWWTFSYSRVLDAGGAIAGLFILTNETTDQVLSDAALLESEARYRTLFNSIDEGFCIIEFLDGPLGPASDYVHVEANAAYARHAGIPDVVGQRVREMVPEEAEGWVALYGGVLATGEPIRFQRELVATRRQLELAAFRVEPASRRQVAVLFQDVTGEVRARERFRLAIEATQAGIFDYDLLAGELGWDERVRDLFGVGPQEPVGYETTFLPGLHPDDRARVDAAVQAAIDPAGPGVFEVEYRVRPQDGAPERWLAARGKAVVAEGRTVRFTGTVRDITADKEAEAALRATEERYHLVTRATNDAVWDWDLVSNHVLWNEALTAAYGHPPDEIEPTGEWWIAQIHPDDRARIDASIHGVIDGSRPFWTDEYRFRRADGSYAAIFDRGYVIRDGAGTAVRMIGAMLDLTERKRAEERLRELNETLEQRVAQEIAARAKTEEALRQSQKMEAVGQLTGGIAHDFNNLLAGISGSLELMQSRIGQGRLKDVERYMAAAQGAARRAAALTHRLLAFSRRQTLDPRPTNVNQLVAGMEELIRRSVGPAVDIEVVGAAGLWPALVDPPQLENALLNLCINARDAMPEGGRITIETANKWLDDRAARERDLDPGQYLSLCVSDTGTGMAPEVLARAFDPFFTTKPLGEGTGLGLSMIYGFAQQSGGQVRIYSEIGQGTTVCIYLPRHYGEAEEAGPFYPSGEAPRAGPGETVLVVDDEPTVRMLVTEVLEDLGYTAIEAADSVAGLKVLQSDVRIDLLITDVGLPGGMNGRQMADAGRARRPDLKVLFITGYAENAAVGNGHLEPGMAVLTKPFVVEALGLRIREMIARG